MNVLMPQLGETVNEGTVVIWHKEAGDPVTKGDVLLDVETDKVATEIPAPATGVLSAISVAEGETVDVGTVLAVIRVEGETAATAESAATSAASPAAVASKGSGLPQKSAGNRLSPAVRRLLKEHGLDSAGITGTGRDGRVTRDDVIRHLASDTSPATAAERIDVIRNLASDMSPASAAERIDVIRHLASDTSPATAAERIDVIRNLASDTSPATAAERIPFDRIRRTTAERMLRSKTTSPHVLQAIDVDFLAVDSVRLARRQQWRTDHGYSLSYLPFVARALCRAIAEFPKVNASVDGDALLVHNTINLAIAVDLDFAGLVAPVVRDAAALTVPQLAQQFNELGAKARSGKLAADDLSGGTYTLSNPGPFGTLFTAPIINQPQVGILSMDAVKKRPVVLEENGSDSIVIRPVGVLAHSFDHRAIDGAYSAAFLNALKTLLEQTDWKREFPSQ